jgi:hypothetical protein
MSQLSTFCSALFERAGDLTLFAEREMLKVET